MMPSPSWALPKPVWQADKYTRSLRRLYAIHLLPAFDEYLIGYRDRTPVLDAPHTRRVIGINGLVAATAIVQGRVVATWKRAGDTDVALAPLRALADAEHEGIQRAAQRWRRFLGGAR